MGARRRLRIWLGDSEEVPGDIKDYFIHTEDSMIMIESNTEEDVEVLIGPALFPQIRSCMDSLEER